MTKKTFLADLHPVSSLGYVGMVCGLSLVTDNPLLQMGLFFSVLGLAFTNRLPIGSWLRFGTYTGLMVILINVLVNYNGQTVLCYRPALPLLGAGPITLEALVFGLVMALRLLTIMLAFHVYSQTVVADDLLAVFGRGASRLAVTIILALRFFPIMANEATRLWEVQRTRGWAEGRGFVQRLRARWPLLQALLVAALERSWQVGEAMQARGFGAGRRSCYLPLTVRPRDWLWRIILMVSLAAAVYLGWQGQLSYQFFPYLGRTGWPNPGLMLMLLGLAGPVLVSWWWNRCPSWRSKI